LKLRLWAGGVTLAATVAATVGVVACTPALNWREVHPEGSAAQLLFPCKPSSHAREMDLAGARAKVSLYACEASGMTFALTFAELNDPFRVPEALQAWRRAAQENIGAAQSQVAPSQVLGQTPHAQSGVFQMQGRRADGSPLASHVLLAVKGTQVIQVTVLGSTLQDAAVDTFLQSLRLLP
jgi:hypothetical protein